jgi:ABC-type Mn2+/Zn2+ transport system ATPase subunit
MPFSCSSIFYSDFALIFVLQKKISGSITLNGKPPQEGVYHRQVAYVQQVRFSSSVKSLNKSSCFDTRKEAKKELDP